MKVITLALMQPTAPLTAATLAVSAFYCSAFDSPDAVVFLTSAELKVFTM